MPAHLLARRTALVAAIIGMFCGTAMAVPLWPKPSVPTTGGGATLVQDRLIPGWLGGNRQQRVELPDNTATRIDQLETQVRNLTGQVEQLTFALRRLEAAMADGTPPPAGQPGLAPPPATLNDQRSSLPQERAPSGPVDLSALNRGTPAPLQPAPAAPQTVAPAAAPPSDELTKVRSLYQSGRYAMAQQEAEALLAQNPSGAVAGEARFMLGEALLAQGQYRDAANLFLENYTSDPNGSRAPASLLRLGTSLNGLGEREAACSSLEELFTVYPNVDSQLRAQAEQERRAANCV